MLQTSRIVRFERTPRAIEKNEGSFQGNFRFFISLKQYIIVNGRRGMIKFDLDFI